MGHYIERRCYLHGIYMADPEADSDPCPDCPRPELRIVFDGPPGHNAGRFVECEDSRGRSINAGEWRERPDGMWELVITELHKVVSEEDRGDVK